MKLLARLFFALAAVGLLATFAHAQTDASAPDAPILLELGKVPASSFPALDLEALADEDLRRDADSGLPRRFAVARGIDVSTQAGGLWAQADSGDWVWQYKVRGSGAVHLNFGFDQVRLPEGARLDIFGAKGATALGPYTAADIPPHGQLWTAVLDGEDATIQLRVPATGRNQAHLRLTRVGQGYRGFGHFSKVCKSGSCNTDVACLASNDPWNRPRRSVGAYTVGGTDTCTGSLLNNTANDRRMLFATATHCGVGSNSAAQSMVVYWNYESPTCRVPGSAASGTPIARPTTTSQGLAFVAATNSPWGSGTASSRSDFTLIELVTPPVGNSFNLHWAGWDRRPPPTTCGAPADPASTAGLCASIHHPGVDEKRITFVEVNMPLSGISGAQNTHWRANWDPTPPRLANISPMPPVLPPSVTEPGSSGSPLYNARQRLVGVLSGGASYCGASASQLNDDYGGLFAAWEGVGTSTTRARDHLDPLGLAPDFIDGIDNCNPPPAPTGVTAVATAPNQITLSWNAAAGADRYRVLRTLGTCPGTGYVEIGEVTGTGFVDGNVSGGSAYSYRVIAWNDAEECPSVQSSCASATATGTCALPPDFAGLASATSAGSATQCGINLAWTAATASCGAASDIRYNVYRSTAPGFTPDAGNLLASCLTGTALADVDGVGAGVPQHYIVRAEDLTGQPASGQCGGVEDANLVIRSAAAFGPDIVSFSDDVESGSAQWAVTGSGAAGSDFAIVTTDANSPTHSWFVPDPNGLSDRQLAMAQSIALVSGTTAVLSFAHRYATEASYDGAVLEYSLDNGTTWVDILAGSGAVPANGSRFLANGYTTTISTSYGSAIGGRSAWAGNSGGFLVSRVTLADFGGQSVRFRFRFASDQSVGSTGWWIDDVEIVQGTSCAAGLPAAIFADGFELP